MAEQPPLIDKAQARRAFSRAARRYDEAAALQREIGARMLSRLDYVRLQPQVVLDAGTGTGEACDHLLRRYPKAQIIALDFALPMLRRAARRGRWLRRPRCLCADIERLPLADDSVDLIYSNVTLQWCNDLEGAFREFHRVLRPDGLLMFSTFGPDTLRELREAWSAVDGAVHVSPFYDMHDIGDALLRVGLADPVMDVDRMTVTYDSVDGLMRDLKLLGAHNVASGRPKGLTGRGRMQAMRAAYECFRHEGRLPASYEVVYGHAWAPQVASTATLVPPPALPD